MSFWMHEEFWISIGSVVFFAGFWFYVKPVLYDVLDKYSKEFTDELSRLNILIDRAQDLIIYYDKYMSCQNIFEKRVIKSAKQSFTQKDRMLAEQKNYQHRQFIRLNQSLQIIIQDSDRCIEHLIKQRLVTLVTIYLQQHTDQYYVDFISQKDHSFVKNLMKNSQ